MHHDEHSLIVNSDQLYQTLMILLLAIQGDILECKYNKTINKNIRNIKVIRSYLTFDLNFDPGPMGIKILIC